jgi:hypothetical protein
LADSQRRPAFTGLVVHRDPDIGYSLLLPDGWHGFDLAAGDGKFYAPEPNDMQTGFEAAGQRLDIEVQASDLPAIRRGFFAGLRQLPSCKIESREAVSISRLITLEARLTFLDGEQVRKRWVRLLYQGHAQVRLVAQGATPELFNYWEPMFFTAMRSVRFADWWSDAIGVEWMDRSFRDEDADPAADGELPPGSPSAEP